MYTFLLLLPLILLALPVAVISVYLFTVTLLAWFPRILTADGLPLRFAVIIPAHDEEEGVAATVQGVMASDYPRDQYDVFVIADNCTDATAAKAREAGANVLERSDPANRGKGQALDWLLKGQRETLATYDALDFVDADTFVHPSFLSEAASSLRHPAVQAMQGRYLTANPGANWRTALTFAGMAGVNHTRPLGQTRLGGGVSLKGNGMAFRASLLLERGWPAHSIVEDMELGIQLLQDGIQVAYNPRAIVTSDMPTGAKAASKQRRRWEGGRFQTLRIYGPRLLTTFVRTRGMACLDALLELAIPPLTLLVLAQVVFGGLAIISGGLAWLVLSSICLAITAFYVATTLCLTRAPFKVWLTLAAAPLFILWKIPVYCSLLLRRQKNWERTTRPGE